MGRGAVHCFSSALWGGELSTSSALWRAGRGKLSTVLAVPCGGQPAARLLFSLHTFSDPREKQTSGGDAFGNDPFAPSFPARPPSSPARPPSSPARPPSSPTPALPPKQGKKHPPPRPAPPKSKSPAPNKPKADPFGDFGADPFAGSDPFSGGGGGGKGTSNSNSFDAFANFNDFGKGESDGPWGGGSSRPLAVTRPGRGGKKGAAPQPAKRRTTAAASIPVRAQPGAWGDSQA
ncbi:hypothetical protein ACOMHN_049160 [Nucella lapillus]